MADSGTEYVSNSVLCGGGVAQFGTNVYNSVLFGEDTSILGGRDGMNCVAMGAESDVGDQAVCLGAYGRVDDKSVAVGGFMYTDSKAVAIGASNREIRIRGQYSALIGGEIIIPRFNPNTSRVTNSVCIGMNNWSFKNNCVIVGCENDNVPPPRFSFIPTFENIVVGCNNQNRYGRANIVIGHGASPSVTNQLFLGSPAYPVLTNATAGAVQNFLNVWVNDLPFKIALHARS